MNSPVVEPKISPEGSEAETSSAKEEIKHRDMMGSIQQLNDSVMQKPDVFYKHMQNFNEEYMKILQGTSEIKPERRDRRFKDPVWMENPYYKMVVQTYLSAVKGVEEWVDETQEDKTDAKRAHFLTSLVTEAASPSNSALNPQVLKRIYETQGSSLTTGFMQMAEDAMYGGGMPAQVDKTAFEVGKNLATTEGSVVYRSERFELIQYKPQTEDVHAIPVLTIPPQINKYYGLDLKPENSLMHYMANNQVQMFTISWKNPSAENRDWGFAEYILSAVEAIDVVREICGSDSVNLFASCAGAMTTAAAVAYLNDIGEGDKVNTLTMAAFVLDASKSDSLLGLFATPESVKASKAGSEMRGFLDGQEMGKIFAWMRPNDLVWSFFVNNYLCGQKPPAFDLLYWSSDSTRLPAKFHADIMDIFMDNVLADGKMLVNGRTIDLSKVVQDAYIVAGTTDHITPWEAVYGSTKLLSSDVRFVLANSGHIQSIINPPGNPKALYFKNKNKELPEDSAKWQETSTEHNESWWGDWMEWFGKRNTDMKKTPVKAGSKAHEVIEAAPGSYVLEK